MKKIILKLGAWAATLPILLLGSNALAEQPSNIANLDEVGDKMGIDTSQSLAMVVGETIKFFTSTLGLIFVVLVVYAGYMYLTAAGDDEKVKKAKKLLGQAVIGLIIVLSAFAITTFIVAGIEQATVIDST